MRVLLLAESRDLHDPLGHGIPVLLDVLSDFRLARRRRSSTTLASCGSPDELHARYLDRGGRFLHEVGLVFFYTYKWPSPMDTINVLRNNGFVGGLLLFSASIHEIARLADVHPEFERVVDAVIDISKFDDVDLLRHTLRRAKERRLGAVMRRGLWHRDAIDAGHVPAKGFELWPNTSRSL